MLLCLLIGTQFDRRQIWDVEASFKLPEAAAYRGTAIAQLIEKCLQHHPDDRFQNCEELMYALEHLKEADEAIINQKRRQKLGRILTYVVAVIAVCVAVLIIGLAAHGLR